MTVTAHRSLNGVCYVAGEPVHPDVYTTVLDQQADIAHLTRLVTQLTDTVRIANENRAHAEAKLDQARDRIRALAADHRLLVAALDAALNPEVPA